MITIIKKYISEIILGIIFLIYFSGIIKNVEIYGIGLGALAIAFGIYEKIRFRSKIKNDNIVSLKTNNDKYRKTSKLILGIIAIVSSIIGLIYLESEKSFLTVLLILGTLLFISSLISENSSYIEILNERLRIENKIDLTLNSISSINLTKSEIIFNQSGNLTKRIDFLANNRNKIEELKAFFEQNIKQIEIK
jgi:hypothetical protein